MGTRRKSANDGLFPLQPFKVVLSAVTVTIWSFLTNQSAFMTSGFLNSSRAWTSVIIFQTALLIQWYKHNLVFLVALLH